MAGNFDSLMGVRLQDAKIPPPESWPDAVHVLLPSGRTPLVEIALAEASGGCGPRGGLDPSAIPAEVLAPLEAAKFVARCYPWGRLHLSAPGWAIMLACPTCPSPPPACSGVFPVV